MNLANSPAFQLPTVSTNQDLNTLRLRTAVDNNETTCKQFIGRDEWIKIWLGDNASVGTLTITSKEAGKLTCIISIYIIFNFQCYNLKHFLLQLDRLISNYPIMWYTCM